MFLLLLLFIASCASAQPCMDHESVDLSDVKSSIDGSIVQDGVIFPPKYVYSKKVDGEMRTYGCLCQDKYCFRKCCPVGSVMYGRNCTNMPESDLLLSKGLDTYYSIHLRKNVDMRKTFDLLYGKPCDAVYMEDKEWFVQQNGSLFVHVQNYVPDKLIYGPDKYCIDTFVSDKKYQPQLNALICFADTQDQDNYGMSSSCMLISCFFILLTVAVYAWLPELRNLHGMVLMAYLLSFFVGFLFLGTMQILILRKEITQDICTSLTFVIYLSLLSAFFWLNVMCYDIWWTFSGQRAHGQERSTKKRFIYYAIYAFGVPTALTILLAWMEFTELPMPDILLPKLRLQGCFLSGTSKLLYFNGPILALCVVNMTFFTLTAFKIWKIKKETNKALRNQDSSTNDQNRKDTQRFTLYVKLFTVMGINWILEVVSTFYPDADFFWQFSDAYNVLVGLIIFIIFVCKKKTINLIKKRYRKMRGLPMSRTQTTTSISTRTLSQSRDEIKMNSIKK